MGIIYNSSLCCLSGLDNIMPESIFNLNIHNNPLLTMCAVESICDYLVNPAGAVDIHENASGCNSIEEIELACNIIPSVEDLTSNNKFKITPNPCSGSINLRYKTYEVGTLIFDVMDLSGVKVKSQTFENLKPGTHELEIDLNDLPAGIYFCTLKIENELHITKMIKL